MRKLLAICVLGASIGGAAAQDIKFNAYADFRLVHPSDELSWMEGGLGKFRFDHDQAEIVPVLAELLAEGTWQVTPDILSLVSVRYEENQRTPLDVLEAYVRYRPVSTNEWRWSVKLGAFWPEISLENNEVGWTSFWTLTPSAINSWVGEELRTIGGEGKLEWRDGADTIEAVAAIFGGNDPAGVLIDVRGWSMNDRPTGIFDRVRLPDAAAASLGVPTPFYAWMFREIDDRPGWYTSLAWEREGVGRATVMRYDNEADASAVRNGLIAWHTEFWSAGFETELFGLTFLAQGMNGETAIHPVPYERVVDFHAAYLLAGYDMGEARVSARFDVFGTGGTEAFAGFGAEGNYSERGYAFTLASSWVPEEWLRITGETIYLDSYRPQRAGAGLDPNADELQLQLAARLYY
jgi:hypothetical protein